MNQAVKLAIARGTAQNPAPQKAGDLIGSRAKTRLLDVVSLEGSVMTGLYVLEKGGARPLKHGEDPRGKELLARTGGLTPEQKADLTEQGVAIYYLREAPIPYRNGEMSLQRSEERYGTIWGTEVVPYVSLSEHEATAVANRMARMMMASCGW